MLSLKQACAAQARKKIRPFYWNFSNTLDWNRQNQVKNQVVITHDPCRIENGIAKSPIKLIRTYAMSMSDPALGDCTEVMVLPG